MSSTISHEKAQERAYIAAAHNEKNSDEARERSLNIAEQLHLKRVGTELNETLDSKRGPSADQPGLAETAEGRKERAYIAAAHREGRDEDTKIESLEKASEVHEERTGEPLPEALYENAAQRTKEIAKERKAQEKKESTPEHIKNQERSLVGAAHNEKNSDEAREKALEKAEKLHMKRVGTELHETLDSKKTTGPQQPGLSETEEGRKERSYIAAAHRDGRDEEARLESLQKASELHEERTGEPLREAVLEGIAEAKIEESAKEKKAREKKEREIAKEEAHLEHQERAYVAAAHRKGRDEEGKKESLLKANEIHEEREGSPLPEAMEKGLVDEDGNEIKESHKRKRETSESEKESEKVQRVDQPGITSSADGRKERALIAAAHRDGRSEEGQLESLKKANELHEKRTGESLPEAVERGVAAQ